MNTIAPLLRTRRCTRTTWCLAALLTLATGCASLDLPEPPVEDVAEKRRERTEAAIREFEDKRDFAEFQAALARYHRNDLHGCEEGLQQLLRRNAKYRDARLMLAEMYLENNRSQEAFDQVQQALRDHPDDSKVWYTMGLLLDATGQSAGALAYYEQAAELEPNDELYALSYRTALSAETTGGDEFADRAGYAVAARTEPAAEQQQDGPQISAAVAALRRNQPEAAVELLRPFALRGCRSAQVYRIMGVAHYRLGDYRSSQVALQQALSLDNSSALTYSLMGCTLAKLGQRESAQAYLRQARAIDPTYSAGR